METIEAVKAVDRYGIIVCFVGLVAALWWIGRILIVWLFDPKTGAVTQIKDALIASLESCRTTHEKHVLQNASHVESHRIAAKALKKLSEAIPGFFDDSGELPPPGDDRT